MFFNYYARKLYESLSIYITRINNLNFIPVLTIIVLIIHSTNFIGQTAVRIAHFKHVISSTINNSFWSNFFGIQTSVSLKCSLCKSKFCQYIISIQLWLWLQGISEERPSQIQPIRRQFNRTCSWEILFTYRVNETWNHWWNIN